ncbi:MerR family DNA-binding transcriptional regulator [Demequina sp. B12]|uniref:TipAS antibiotic-recognition domain-containing protein n=1 Tax=Demequina sp. B12 TaxID=2992757 RepID=UPI00237B2B34|nr:TipAS antibiotic-recognition domain-containing protein [Demequina sp. B12]MDE0572705.1 MerR family DNA-binding transcriptional regulator [Demequina sp. B12]
MDLSIGQVAKRTGVSARMLRHYDHLGLFPPSRVSDNGYRWYGVEMLPRLYRIVSLRRAGVGLGEIARILDEHTSEADALRQHLAEVRAEQARLEVLAASIEEQIARLDGARVEDPEALRGEYRREFAQLVDRLKIQYPAGLVESYAAYARGMESMSVADIEHVVAASAEVMSRLAEMARRGVSVDSDEAQRGVADHYALLTQSVPLSVDAYGALGRSYVDDPLQHSIVVSFGGELPEWLRQAIEVFAGR